MFLKEKIMRIQHIFPFYPDLKSAQFYNLELEKSESIKEAIALNKSTTVNFLLNKWIDSDNPTLQISAFKVVCDDEERKKLSMARLVEMGKPGRNRFIQRVYDEMKYDKKGIKGGSIEQNVQ